jgi:hypothetical protein
MGYSAVGLGETDFSANLLQLLASYAVQNPNKPPVVLAANILGVTRDNAGRVTQQFAREQYFPGGDDKSRPSVEAHEVLIAPGRPTVGVVGVVGKEVALPAEKQDASLGFAAVEWALRQSLDAFNRHPSRPTLRVLLYAGSHELAQEVARSFPEFQLIVCQTPQSEPPQFPTMMNNGKTMIVQVGQKGKNLGVVGVFPSKSGQPQLRYQLVPLGEEYITPDDPDAIKSNRVLALLEQYAAEVKQQNLLENRPRPVSHTVQVRFPDKKPTYVGAQVCLQCHPNEYAVWKGSRHSHAYEALEKASYRPSLRQYDPECVVCHVTGFEYQGGFESETKTAHLKGNQCENCHGPGSAHANAPTDRSLYIGLAPWKGGDPNMKLPPLGEIVKLAAADKVDRGAINRLPADQQRVINSVSSMCLRCHDEENDPKFNFLEYFPRIHHSGMKEAANQGLPPGLK